jgi:hypothetical protein
LLCAEHHAEAVKRAEQAKDTASDADTVDRQFLGLVSITPEYHIYA